MHPIKNEARFAKNLALLIIAIGIALRLFVYFQNRDLMVDELNVVRNVYERGFLALLQPLDYQQYAPPLFLWFLKLAGTTLGYGEPAMRLLPLLASAAALILLYKLLRHLGIAAIPALCSFAFSAFIIRYSTDVKQYLSDAMVVLLLLHLTTKVSIQRPARSFLLIWIPAGTIAILLSMPAAFQLLGVGCYYLLEARRDKRNAHFITLGLVGFSWLLVFGLYYWFILRFQIGSDYLQSWHSGYFLDTSFSGEAWKRNGNLLQSLLEMIAGTALWPVVVLYFLLFIMGIIHLAKRLPGMALLTLIPIAVTLFASGLHMFTLLPRVCIFLAPLFLIVASYGLYQLVAFRPAVFKKVALAISLLVCITVNPVYLLAHRLEVDELSASVAFAQSRGVAAHQIFLQEWVTPSVVYYSEIHPDRSKYQSYNELSVIPGNAQLDSFAHGLTQKSLRYAFVYYWIDDATLQEHRQKVFSLLTPVDSLVKPSYRVMIYKAP